MISLGTIDVDDVCCSGIIPRSAAEIFEKADADREFEYHVSMSYIQIYMEQVTFNSLSIRFQT
jgi:kinesin family protein 5